MRFTRAAGEFIGFGEQYQHLNIALYRPFDHLLIEIFKRMTYVHQHHETLQAQTFFQVFPQRALPLDLHLFGYLRITIAGQVDKALALSDFEQVNQLRTPRGFGGTRQVLLISQRIQRAGFSRVGAAGERHFNTGIGRKMADIWRASDKVRQLIIPVGQDGRLR